MSIEGEIFNPRLARERKRGYCFTVGSRSLRRHEQRRHPRGRTTYDLRHSFAQAMIDSGEQPEVVTRLLGHKSSQMVWTYSRIRDDRLVEAAQVLKLRKGA